MLFSRSEAKACFTVFLHNNGLQAPCVNVTVLFTLTSDKYICCHGDNLALAGMVLIRSAVFTATFISCVFPWNTIDISDAVAMVQSSVIIKGGV